MILYKLLQDKNRQKKLPFVTGTNNGKNKNANKSSKQGKRCAAQVEYSEIDEEETRELLKHNDLH